MRNKSKAVAFMGLCTALALILAFVETLIPPLFPAVPGIKMGLPNIVIIFLLYRKNWRCAALVSLLRILLAALLFGNTVALLYSVAGGVLSLVSMALLRRVNAFSAVGVSVVGGVAHNVGQVLMAMLLLDTTELIYYLLVLTVSGTVAGVFIGLCGAALIRKFPKNSRFFDR